MANNPDFFVLFCCLHDEPDCCFSVKVNKGATVDDLKTSILVVNPDIGLHRHIGLWKVSIPDDELDAVQDAIQDPETLNGSTRMRGLLPLSHYFDKQPPGKTLHIIVQHGYTQYRRILSGSNEIRDVTSIPTVALRVDVSAHLSKKSADIDHLIKKYLDNRSQLGIWESDLGTEELRHHIASLRIPFIHGTAVPSLLLHNLGDTSYDLCILKHFTAQSSELKFLYNTSGSGKTRFMFEVLWRKWGLYFTSRTTMDKIGSDDLSNILDTFENLNTSPLVPMMSGFDKFVQDRNTTTASRFFLSMILARLFIFHSFVTLASAMPGGLRDEHKGQWLLLQLSPRGLVGWDIFDQLTFEILALESSSDDIMLAITPLLVGIQKIIGNLGLTFAIDETQIPSRMCTNCFRSESNPEQPRPLTGIILNTSRKVASYVMMAGTGMSLAIMKEMSKSTVAREINEVKFIKELGWFDSASKQHAYMERYCPKALLRTDLWGEVLSRAAKWLCGRHRFTATFISHLLQNGFESPHRLLNELIHIITGFWPSDADELVCKEPEIRTQVSSVFSFDFSRMTQNQDLTHQLAGVTFDYTLGFGVRSMGSKENKEAVECGFARFKGQTTLIDEPLAILSLQRHFSVTPWTPDHFIRDGLSSPNPAQRGAAFEQFCTYRLLTAFKSPRRLSEIFQFLSPSPLQDMMAHVVAISKTNGTTKFYPLDITSDRRPSHIFGCTASTQQQTLLYLKSPHGIAFCCFPPPIGPDMVLFLQLSDGSLLRVLVQYKQHKSNLSSTITSKGFRTTSPINFISRRKSKKALKESEESHGTSSSDLPIPSGEFFIYNLPLNEELQAALLDLGPSNPHAGPLGVLRVLCSYPAVPNMERLKEDVKIDTGSYPAATMKVEMLAIDAKDKGLLEKLPRASVPVSGKRPAEGSDNVGMPSARKRVTTHNERASRAAGPSATSSVKVGANAPNDTASSLRPTRSRRSVPQSQPTGKSRPSR